MTGLTGQTTWPWRGLVIAAGVAPPRADSLPMAGSAPSATNCIVLAFVALIGMKIVLSAACLLPGTTMRT